MSPIVSKAESDVYYVDHADRETLQAKYATDPNVDIQKIAPVDAHIQPFIESNSRPINPRPASDCVVEHGAIDAFRPRELREVSFEIPVAAQVIF